MFGLLVWALMGGAPVLAVILVVAIPALAALLDIFTL